MDIETGVLGSTAILPGPRRCPRGHDCSRGHGCSRCSRSHDCSSRHDCSHCPGSHGCSKSHGCSRRHRGPRSRSFHSRGRPNRGHPNRRLRSGGLSGPRRLHRGSGHGTPGLSGRRTLRLPHQPAHHRHQLPWFERLRHERVHPGRGPTVHVSLRAGAHHRDPHIPRPRVGPQPRRGRDPVQPRHDHVQRHHVRTHLPYDVQALGTVGGGHHLEALQLKVDPDQLPDDLVVVDDKHPAVRTRHTQERRRAPTAAPAFCPLLPQEKYTPSPTTTVPTRGPLVHTSHTANTATPDTPAPPDTDRDRPRRTGDRRPRRPPRLTAPPPAIPGRLPAGRRPAGNPYPPTPAELVRFHPSPHRAGDAPP